MTTKHKVAPALEVELAKAQQDERRAMLAAIEQQESEGQS